MNIQCHIQMRLPPSYAHNCASWKYINKWNGQHYNSRSNNGLIIINDLKGNVQLK